MISRAFSH